MKGLIGLTMTAVALVLVVGGKAYHFICRPEWTQVQGGRNLWWLWLLAIVVGTVGYCLVIGDRHARKA